MDISEGYRRGVEDAKREVIWIMRKFEERRLLRRGETALLLKILEKELDGVTPELCHKTNNPV